MGDKGQSIGYVRVSSVDQNTARQLEGEALDKVFTDHMSGKDTKRPQLQAALQYVRDGDTLVVHSMDRLCRNALDMLQTVKDLTARGVSVRFLKPALLFSGKDSSPMAQFQLTVLAAVAELEREIIRDRQREGIAIAKKKGVYKGGKPSLSDDQVVELQRRVAAREKKAAIARALGVSRGTLYKYLAAAPASAAA
jgi:DNA invertase Pin-like site-specific DNA recombinase